MAHARTNVRTQNKTLLYQFVPSKTDNSLLYACQRKACLLFCSVNWGKSVVKRLKGLNCIHGAAQLTVVHSPHKAVTPLPYLYDLTKMDHPFSQKGQSEIPLQCTNKIINLQDLQWFLSLSIGNPTKITTTALLGEYKNRNIFVLLLGSN